MENRKDPYGPMYSAIGLQTSAKFETTNGSIVITYVGTDSER